MLRHDHDLDPARRLRVALLGLLTMLVIVSGVGTVLYTFRLLLATLVEGHLRDLVGRRRVEQGIARANGHTIVCGWGRVGRAVAASLTRSSQQVVVLDHDTGRLADCGRSQPDTVADP